MAVRPYWKGYLKLSLVTCPVAMSPATSESEKVRFHTLNKATGNRVVSQESWPGRVVPQRIVIGHAAHRLAGPLVHQPDPQGDAALKAEVHGDRLEAWSVTGRR